MFTSIVLYSRRSLFGVAIALLVCAPAALAQCDREAVTRVKVTVYQDTPRFMTGEGWVLAAKLTELEADTRVMVCEERSVGFLFRRKKWLRIRFPRQDGAQEGWIFGEGTVTSVTSRITFTDRVASLFLPRNAYAQPGIPSSDAGLPGPAWPVYMQVFIAICLGMVAKGLFDAFGSDEFVLRDYLKRTVRALIVSPIVFAAFASVGDFGVAALQSFLIYLCMAFQNGFFWQTVLVRVGEAR